MIYETVGLLIKYEKSDSLIKESVALFINICAIRFIIYESVEPFIKTTYESVDTFLYETVGLLIIYESVELLIKERGGVA